MYCIASLNLVISICLSQGTPGLKPKHKICPQVDPVGDQLIRFMYESVGEENILDNNQTRGLKLQNEVAD